MKIYINGFLDRTISCTTPGSKYNGTFNIGSEQTMRFFIGEIDDVRVYATALTLDQITEIYKVKAVS